MRLHFPNLLTTGLLNLDPILAAFTNTHRWITAVQALDMTSLVNSTSLSKYFNTIISLLFKGEEEIEQNFSLHASERKSLLWRIMRPSSLLKHFRRINGVSIHNVSTFIYFDLFNVLGGNVIGSNLLRISHMTSSHYFWKSLCFTPRPHWIDNYAKIEIPEPLPIIDIDSYRDQNFWKKANNLTPDEIQKIVLHCQSLGIELNRLEE